MAEIKIPTTTDLKLFDGAHGFDLWKKTPDDWRCPACDRSKIQLLRWARRNNCHIRSSPVIPCKDKPGYSMGWFAVLHGHHDYSGKCRFPETIICDQCNLAEGRLKRSLGLSQAFSFSPSELARIITGVPHGNVKVDLGMAKAVLTELGVSVP